MFWKLVEWAAYAIAVIGGLVVFYGGVNPLLAVPVQGDVVGRDGDRIVVRYPAMGSTAEKAFDTDGLTEEPRVGRHVTVYHKEGRSPLAYLKGQGWTMVKWGWLVGGAMIAVSIPLMVLANRRKSTPPT